MKLYFAPMEGITPYVFRNIHNEMFGGCDAYYAPFIVPTDNERISLKTLRDILRKNNTAKVVPQVLCSNAEAFVRFSEKLPYMGYDELNLNMGCPSGTVVKKRRGAGALKDLDMLDGFLESIFKNCKIDMAVSEEELSERRKNWTPPEPKIKTGYIARYQKLVTSADKGAILEG